MSVYCCRVLFIAVAMPSTKRRHVFDQRTEEVETTNEETETDHAAFRRAFTGLRNPDVIDVFIRKGDLCLSYDHFRRCRSLPSVLRRQQAGSGDPGDACARQDMVKDLV